MELYAAGFNAWNQLRFDSTANDEDDSEPEDTSSFTCVLEDAHIERPRSWLSFTIVETSSGLRSAGSLSKDHARLYSRPQEFRLIAEASNGAAVALDKDGVLHQSPSLNALLNKHDHESFALKEELTQLVAYDTGFVALSSNGQVWTWGDERYGSCLGRETSEESPADQPGLIPELQDLPTGPITKVAAGGYIVGALTSGHDLYLWGGRPGAQPVVEGIGMEPMPIDIEGKDILDMAVGGSHIVALTTDREVYVIGTNDNGQLGSALASANVWTQVDLGLGERRRITGVAAGPRCSFILVQEV